MRYTSEDNLSSDALRQQVISSDVQSLTKTSSDAQPLNNLTKQIFPYIEENNDSKPLLETFSKNNFLIHEKSNINISTSKKTNIFESPNTSTLSKRKHKFFDNDKNKFPKIQEQNIVNDCTNIHSDEEFFSDDINEIPIIVPIARKRILNRSYSQTLPKKPYIAKCKTCFFSDFSDSIGCHVCPIISDKNTQQEMKNKWYCQNCKLSYTDTDYKTLQACCKKCDTELSHHPEIVNFSDPTTTHFFQQSNNIIRTPSSCSSESSSDILPILFGKKKKKITASSCSSESSSDILPIILQKKRKK